MTTCEIKMVKPSLLNPLGYIIQRQYRDNVIIKNKLFSERFSKAKNLYRKDLLAHYGCVNAIEFSEEGELLVSGGDDRRILLWSVAGAIYDRGIPFAMHTTHSSNIFCVAFDRENKKIFSGGNDDQVLIHETYSGHLKTKIPHRKPVYGLSINRQNDNVLATAGDDGRILLFDLRESSSQDVQVLAKQKTGFHSVMFNPTNPRFLVTANSEDGIALWDCRKPREKLLYYDSNSGKISGISACFDSTGKKILALRRRLPPVLYATQSEHALCQFYHPQYYNSCTMKTCCFAGDDDYVLSGSDDFNLYMWKIPPDDCEWGSSHVILRGHRSIVNQVRYNKHNNLIASSGVEKMVKLWSAIPIGTWKGSILKEHSDPMRTVYTHEDYISLVGATGERISHDYSDQSTNEDSKMMAFFDSLIQREIEGWDSSSDGSLTSDSDSDVQEDWSKLVSHIFRNGRNGSDEPKKTQSQPDSPAYFQEAEQTRQDGAQQIVELHPKMLPEGEEPQKEEFQAETATSAEERRGQQATVQEISHGKGTKTQGTVTRQSVRDFYEQNHTLDAPSTSTGITNSNGVVYRVIEQDSDEEGQGQIATELCDENHVVEEDILVNILPTPLNGTHDMFVNVLEMANGAADGAPSRGRVRSLAPAASGKQLRLDVGRPASTREQRIHGGVRVSASDSGCATGPSSSSSYSLRNSRNHQECFANGGAYQDRSSDEEYKYEKFREADQEDEGERRQADRARVRL
ncbi:hypothetical protein NQ318_013247 [Aromia moschata]|uniref:DDB1- and CUL4-associated factor 5 n=1 Tax=Aromia moschata TaxID=1265417 RepID=A0AAV8XSF7_9CUCU|nr:hypothetical protein NQ318_013247 [Aromia moschata]